MPELTPPDKYSRYNTVQFDEILNAVKKQAQLRDVQPVSVTELPLPDGAANSENQTISITVLSNILTELERKVDSTETQPVSASSLPLPSGASTSDKQDTQIANQLDQDNVDSTTGSLNVVDYSHHEIHSGSHFQVKDYVTLGNGAVEDILIITPDTTKWAHFVYGFLAADGESTVQVYEGPTTTANGTAANVRNRNRNYSDTSTTLIYTGPTVTAVGTLIEQQHHGSNKDYGGGARDGEEKVLKQNTKYLLRLTNDTVNDNNINFILNWYEHTNR